MADIPPPSTPSVRYLTAMVTAPIFRLRISVTVMKLYLDRARVARAFPSTYHILRHDSPQVRAPQTNHGRARRLLRASAAPPPVHGAALSLRGGRGAQPPDRRVRLRLLLHPPVGSRRVPDPAADASLQDGEGELRLQNRR
jgi:hypothetical protein